MKKYLLSKSLLLATVLSGLSLDMSAQTTYNFSYTGAVQTWTVPTGVTSVNIDAQGAAGGAATSSLGVTTPGKGGRVRGTLAVTPGTVLYVYVGGAGGAGLSTGATGGFNGGAGTASYFSTYSGGGGGGASDIRIGGVALANRVVVAPGGGGAGYNGACPATNQPGGDGGGMAGADVTTCDGSLTGYTIVHTGGGTQTAGGVGGKLNNLTTTYTNGSDGMLGAGGANNAGGGVGGGGGGGYYGGGGGTWMGGGGGSAYVNAGLITGAVMTAGYNAGAGMVSITSACATPTAGAIVGPSAICVGSSSSLTNPTGTPGGVWSSSNTAVATVNPATGLVTAVSAGMVTINYTVTNTCGSATAATMMTINPATLPVVGGGSLCAGNTLTLTNGNAGGVWSSSNPAAATVNAITGVVTGVAAGSATINYAVACGVTSAVVNVSTAPAPISGVINICAGASSTLTCPTPGGVWTSSNPAVATVGATTGLLTGISTGAVTITYSTGGSCVATKPITVNSLATISGGTSACLGQTITLTNSVSGGIWSSSNPAVAHVGATTGVVTGISLGAATITYSVGGCYTTSPMTVSYITSISGLTTLCAGQTTTLTSSGVGGTWSSSNPAIATVGLTTGLVTGVAGGVATITYTIGTSCRSTIAITVGSMAPITGATGICMGNSTTLTCAAPGGTWSSSNPTRAAIGMGSGIVTGIAGGVVNITYAIGSCRSIVPFTVGATAPISGPATLCLGQSASFTNPYTMGTWSSSDAGVASVNPTSGVVTTVSAGAATISYVSGVLGCSVSKALTVYDAAPITSSGSVCVGMATTVSDPVTGGTWASSDARIGSVDRVSGVVTGVSGGYVTLSYTNPYGCLTTAPFVVNRRSPVTGPNRVCEGQVITLTNAEGGGTWVSSDPTMASVGLTTGLVRGFVAGSVTMTYTLYSGCASTWNVTVNPMAPIMGVGAMCVGTSSIMSDATPGGTWTSNNPAIATIVPSTGVIRGMTNGSVTISYTVFSTGCRATAPVYIISCAREGEETAGETLPEANTALRVFPNPNRGEFVISGALAATDDANVTIEIMDMVGKVVYQTNTVATGGKINERVQLNGNIAGGMYLLNIRSEKENAVYHFVVGQ